MRRKILTLLLSSFFLSLLSLNEVKAFKGESEQRVSTRTQVIKHKSKEHRKNPDEDKLSRVGSKEKEFRALDEAEKHLEELLNQRNMFVGDFYGINQTGYRYVLIFDRLGYIRYRIVKINKEIKATRQKISEMDKMIEQKNIKEKKL